MVMSLVHGVYTWERRICSEIMNARRIHSLLSIPAGQCGSATTEVVVKAGTAWDSKESVQVHKMQ